MKFLIPFIFAFSFLSLNGRAEVSHIAQWSELFRKPKIIAKVVFLENSNIITKAEVISVYKGVAPVGVFWIGNMVPIPVKPGDTCFIFFYPTDYPIDIINDFRDKPENEIQYAKGLCKDGKVLQRYSYGGFYRIKNNKIRCDIPTTGADWTAPWLDLADFDLFVKTMLKSHPEKDFHDFIINKIKVTKEERLLTQFISMLRLTNYTDFDPIIETLPSYTELSFRIELSKLLGQITDPKATGILLTYLKDTNDNLKNEVIIQLKNKDVAIVGPVLLDMLKPEKGELNPADLRDSISGGYDRITINLITSLSALKYAPMIPVISPLLESKNGNVLMRIARILKDFDEHSYIATINKRLSNKNLSLNMNKAVNYLIKTYQLTECIEPLKKYGKENKFGLYEVDVFETLLSFKSENFNNYVKDEFIKRINRPISEPIDDYDNWLRACFKLFKKNETIVPKSELYNSLFFLYGYNSDFIKKPRLFKIKERLELQAKEKIYKYTNTLDLTFSAISTIAFIKNSADYKRFGYKPDYTIHVFIRVDKSNYKGFNRKKIAEKIENLRVLVAADTDIHTKNICTAFWTTYSNKNERFELSREYTSIVSFYKYLKKFGTKKDLKFLKQFQKYEQNEMFRNSSLLNETIEKLKEK